MTKTLMSTAAAALALTAASVANASAVYDAGASTTLTLTSITNATNAAAGDGELEFAVGTGLTTETSDTTGDATASTDFTLNPSAGDALGLIRNSLAVDQSLSNAASVMGTATDGTSTALVETDGDVLVENLSLTDTFEVTFELSYEMFASASADGEDESASAVSFILVETNLIGATATVERDGVVSQLLSGTVLELALDPVAGDGVLSASATLLLTFVVAPGTAVEMFMFADAEGDAVGMADVDADVVPLPGALGFMAFGAAGLAGLRRRKAA